MTTVLVTLSCRVWRLGSQAGNKRSMITGITNRTPSRRSNRSRPSARQNPITPPVVVVHRLDPRRHHPDGLTSQPDQEGRVERTDHQEEHQPAPRDADVRIDPATVDRVHAAEGVRRQKEDQRAHEDDHTVEQETSDARPVASVRSGARVAHRAVAGAGRSRPLAGGSTGRVVPPGGAAAGGIRRGRRVIGGGGLYGGGRVIRRRRVIRGRRGRRRGSGIRRRGGRCARCVGVLVGHGRLLQVPGPFRL